MSLPDITPLAPYFVGAGATAAVITAITRLKKKTPKVQVTYEESEWYKRQETSIVTDINILVVLENKGAVTTTAKSVDLTVTYKGKKYAPLSEKNLNIELNSGASIPKRFVFHMPIAEVVIDDVIERATLQVNHTYGIKTIEISAIKRKTA